MENFIITEKHVGSRLDKFLTKKFPQKSRSFLKKTIENQKVLVNHKPIKSSYLLKFHDYISIAFPAENKISLKPQNIKLDIIFEDSDLIIINKPAGIVVHPDQTHRKNTLVNALLSYYPSIIDVGEKERPGIVHRLDKDTSGLMVVTKNNRAYSYMISLFKNKKIQKKYYALVFGKVADSQGIISYSLRKNSHEKKMSIAQGKTAFTRFKVLNYFYDNQYKYTLLEVSPETGRTHQIRVHLKKIGHPIVGDNTYKFKRFISSPLVKRQLLHAFSLKFSLQSGDTKIFKTGMPKDFLFFLEGLKSYKD